MPSSGWMLTEWIGLNSIVCTGIASICSEYFYTYTIYTLECIYLFCKLIYFKYTYTLMHLFASICSSQRDSMHSVLIYASSGQLQIPQIHTFTLMGELWGIIYTYTLMGNHIQLCTYTLIHLYTYTRIHLCSIIYNATNWNLNTALCNAHCACDTCMCHHQIPQIRTYGATVYVLK